MTVRITPWQEADREAVIALILAIQTAEFGFAITRADQPDLENVEAFYGSGAGGFWCAWAGDELAGTIALKDIGGGHAALRKMFVEKAFRGPEHAVAGQLLEALKTHAATRGIAQIWLGTTPAFTAAHRFYEKNGFSRVNPEDLPRAFPRMALDSVFYRRGLG